MFNSREQLAHHILHKDVTNVHIGLESLTSAFWYGTLAQVTLNSKMSVNSKRECLGVGGVGCFPHSTQDWLGPLQKGLICQPVVSEQAKT